MQPPSNNSSASLSSSFRTVNPSSSIRFVEKLDHKPLRDIIREARLAAGWTQSELAERVDMSQRWVSHIELDTTTAPRVSTLRRVSEALAIDLSVLLIAANLARTKAEALKIAESDIRDDDDETPLVRIAIEASDVLSPSNQKIAIGLIKSLLDAEPKKTKKLARVTGIDGKEESDFKRNRRKRAASS